MNARIITILSIGLNVVLLATAGYLQFMDRQAAGSAPPVVVKPPDVTSEQPFAPVVPFAVKPAVQRTPWEELESTDLRLFHGNLQRANCPDKTMRDILLPMIEERYRQRLTEAMRTSLVSFWQGNAGNRQRNRTRREVEKEKIALIRELFGAAIDMRALQEWHRQYPMGLALGFLPEGKPEQVMWVASKYVALGSEIRMDANGILTPDDRARLQTLYDQAVLELGTFLAPYELEELEARATVAGIAAVFRQSLLGITINGQEMRSLVVTAMRPSNPFLRSLAAGQQLTTEEEQELRRQFEQQMQVTLGPDRMADYQRLQDRRYQAIFLLANKLNVPRKTMNLVYDVYQSAQAEEQKHRGDANLTPQQRDAALKQTNKLAEDAARQLLGDQVFEEMKKARPR